MIRIALVDGPLTGAQIAHGTAAQFCADDGTPHAAAHAAAMAATIAHHAPEVEIVSAAVFPGRLATSVTILSAALDWLLEDPPEIVHCSFGLARPAQVLCARIAQLQEAGSVVVASAAARGVPVYPAGFPDVVSVQGDARCAPDALSDLRLPHARFGACPIASAGDIRGASAAAAHLTGLLATHWPGEASQALDALAPLVRFHGRERRIS